MISDTFKSGFVVIIGKPNTGKSTLINRIIGEKLSITSPKPQTTRYSIKGILNRPDCQLIFIDTPGYLKPRYELQHRMQKIWQDAFKDVDLVVYVADLTSFPTDYDLEVMEHLSGSEHLNWLCSTSWTNSPRLIEISFQSNCRIRWSDTSSFRL